ncbi:hypothetical protein [Melittangium boletus]|uniref:hypothetical protein n=1 Tax=Melittangium boletus TaxID=83453 RepID=UPI003DA593FF
MAWFENVVLKSKWLENERLELSDKNSLYFLGPDLTLKKCSVILKVPARNLIIKQARFIDCSFEVKQPLKNHQQWIFASLEGCRFKGRLSGCDFGHWPEYAEGAEHGAIKDCDFSEAQMDSCRILGSDPATLRFPRWPCFTFLDPIGHAAKLREAPWPALFGRVIVNDLHTHPAATTALTFHAPTIAKFAETTPEELRAVIERFDCLVY